MEQEKDLLYFRTQLRDKNCRWCKNAEQEVSLSLREVEHYDHLSGYDVEGFKERQWLYVTCPRCDYQWSLRKLNIH